MLIVKIYMTAGTYDLKEIDSIYVHNQGFVEGEGDLCMYRVVNKAIPEDTKHSVRHHRHLGHIPLLKKAFETIERYLEGG